jgi:Tfp pilus assembly protein PilO
MLSIAVLCGFFINVLVYFLVAYPLATEVANVAERGEMAKAALIEAETVFDQASGELRGRARAKEELATFYTEVLPQNLSGARRLTHLRLADMAKEANLRYERSTAEPVRERDSELTRLQINVVLSGDYEGIRKFIYAFDSADEFVVVDNIALSQGAAGAVSLVLTMELSTYYWNGNL